MANSSPAPSRGLASCLSAARLPAEAPPACSPSRGILQRVTNAPSRPTAHGARPSSPNPAPPLLPATPPSNAPAQTNHLPTAQTLATIQRPSASAPFTSIPTGPGLYAPGTFSSSPSRSPASPSPGKHPSAPRPRTSPTPCSIRSKRQCPTQSKTKCHPERSEGSASVLQWHELPSNYFQPYRRCTPIR